MRAVGESVAMQYYNVTFLIQMQSELDCVKMGYLIDRINDGERMNMKQIRDWCKAQRISFTTHFRYRKDFPIRANLWNLYSYVRFRLGDV